MYGNVRILSVSNVHCTAMPMAQGTCARSGTAVSWRTIVWPIIEARTTSAHPSALCVDPLRHRIWSLIAQPKHGAPAGCRGTQSSQHSSMGHSLWPCMYIASTSSSTSQLALVAWTYIQKPTVGGDLQSMSHWPEDSKTMHQCTQAPAKPADRWHS